MTEKKLIREAMEVIGSSKDTQAVLMIVKLCKWIAGDEFEVTFEKSEVKQNGC